jgi:hypothetical protein
VRRVMPPAGTTGTGLVGCAVAPTVIPSSVANPQDGQNRAVSGRLSPQRGQVTGGILQGLGGRGLLSRIGTP